MEQVRALFKKEFGQNPVCVARAPGRLELLGNHTDYNQGLVLALTVDRYLDVAAAPRKDGMIELVTNAFHARERFDVTRLTRNPAHPWADYVKGVLHELKARGFPLRGFNAVIHSRIPPGIGLSSSAALQIAATLAYRHLYPFALTSTGLATPPKVDSDGHPPPATRREKLGIARICQQAEEGFVGLRCGLLDTLTCLFGQAHAAVEIDCQSLAIESVPLLGDHRVVVCNSGVQRELTDGGYNTLRSLCDAAAAALGVASLRSVEPIDLKRARRKLSQRQFECASHVTGEIRRVLFGVKALRDDDFEQFGQYMLQSHESSRDLLRNSCPELDRLVARARTHPACYGARLTGGGFGGATINLVRGELAEDFIRHMAAPIQGVPGSRTPPMLCKTGGGARVTKAR